MARLAGGKAFQEEKKFAPCGLPLEPMNCAACAQGRQKSHLFRVDVGSSVFTLPTSQPCGSGRQFQGAAVNLDPVGVVELVESVLQPVDLLLQPGYQGAHVRLLQGGDVADLGGVGVDGGLRAVPG